jgi:glycerol uptake facilitator-like aquaporin
VGCSILLYVYFASLGRSSHTDKSKVTLGLVLGGALPPLRGLFLLPAQLLAAMSAGGLVQCMFPGNVAATNTSLSPDTSIAQGVFIEAFMTAELVFVVLMLAAEKSKDTFIAPIGIGLALFVAMMGGMFSYLFHYTLTYSSSCLACNCKLINIRCLLHRRLA